MDEEKTTPDNQGQQQPKGDKMDVEFEAKQS